MKKSFYRFFLCIILAVILPFSFVGCKKDNNKNNIKSNEKENSSDNQEESYVLTDAEIARIVNSLSEKNNEFVSSLNNANILAPNDYPKQVGNETYSILNYAYYPSLFFSGVDKNIEKNKVVAYISDVQKKYLEVTTNAENDRIFIRMATNVSGEFSYFCYDIYAPEGNVKNISIAFLITRANEKHIKFSQSFISFENKVFESSVGLISEFSETNEQFFKNNFTKDKFASISADAWGYSFYQKIEFNGQKKYNCKIDKMPENSDFLASFDSFEFIDAFEKNDEYKNIENSKLKTITSDVFEFVDTQINYIYDESNFEFKKPQ